MPPRRCPPARIFRLVHVAAEPLAEGDFAGEFGDDEGELDPEVVAKILRASEGPLIVLGSVEEACRMLGIQDDE